MARQAQKTQDSSKETPRRATQAALQKTPLAAVQKAQPTISRESQTRESRTRETDTPEPQAPESKTAEAGPFGGVANGEALEALLKVNEAMLLGMSEMQREIVEFGTARLRLDVETQEALAQCADLRDAYRVHADFTQRAMRDYTEEAAKLLGLSAKVSCDCWGPFEDATRAAFGAMTPR